MGGYKNSSSFGKHCVDGDSTGARGLGRIACAPVHGWWRKDAQAVRGGGPHGQDHQPKDGWRRRGHRLGAAHVVHRRSTLEAGLQGGVQIRDGRERVGAW